MSILKKDGHFMQKDYGQHCLKKMLFLPL